MALLTLASLSLRADDPAPPAPPGFRNVALKQNGHTAYIQVKDSPNPYQNVRDSGDSSPDHFSFSRTSSMANQKYDLGNTASSHDSGAYRSEVERTFLTKSYFGGTDSADKTTPGLNSLVPVSSADSYTHRATGFDKSFATTRADADQNKSADSFNVASSYQGQAATLGGRPVDTFASSMSGKTFQGREADATKRDLNKLNEGLLGMKDLPDRALTIDEVRALINKGVKPQVDAKPPVPSKALNDPAYLPDPAPAPLRVKPGDENHLIDSNDNVPPPPGMIAHPQGIAPPEDSEPLPGDATAKP